MDPDEVEEEVTKRRRLKFYHTSPSSLSQKMKCDSQPRRKREKLPLPASTKALLLERIANDSRAETESSEPSGKILKWRFNTLL